MIYLLTIEHRHTPALNSVVSSILKNTILLSSPARYSSSFIPTSSPTHINPTNPPTRPHPNHQTPRRLNQSSATQTRRNLLSRRISTCGSAALLQPSNSRPRHLHVFHCSTAPLYLSSGFGVRLPKRYLIHWTP
jgi:hypothetical protein